MIAFSGFGRIRFPLHEGIDVVVQFIVDVEKVLQPIAGLQGPVGDLGVSTHLFERRQSAAGKLDVELEPLSRVLGGIPQLILLQWIERIAALLCP